MKQSFPLFPVAPSAAETVSAHEPLHILKSPDKILVQKVGHEIRVLSRFSEDKNIFNRFLEGNNVSSFLPADAPFEAWHTGKVFHEGWDDFAPFLFGGYQDIGANHGSYFTFRVTMLRHWLFERDIGKILTDDAGNRFVIVSIENASDFLIHSDFIRKENQIQFHSAVKGALHMDGKKLNTTSVKRVQLSQRSAAQLSPHNRYNSIKFLADGVAPIRDGEIIECSFAQLEWDLDLCPPDALLDVIAKHPGKYISPTAPELKSIVHSKIIFTFQVHCAYTADAEITFLEKFDHSLLYGMLQSYGTIGFETHEKFIPKLKPFLFADFYWYPKPIDLNAVFPIPEFPPVSRVFTREDCIDPADPPDRYIDLFGNGGKRELGIVLGYSLTQGISRKGAEERGAIVCYLPATTKIYPYAFNRESVQKGASFNLFAYRQYFDPSATEATACYGHWENGSYCIYANYLNSANELLNVPSSLCGGTFEVVEMNGNVTFDDPHLVSQNGEIPVSVDGQGSFVLRIRSSGSAVWSREQ